MTNKEIELKIEQFRVKIEKWVEERYFCSPPKFYTFDEYFHEPPDDNPCVLVILVEGSFYKALWPAYPEHDIFLDEVLSEFTKLIDDEGFLWEHYDEHTVVITPNQEPMCEEFAHYYDRKWLEKTNLLLD